MSIRTRYRTFGPEKDTVGENINQTLLYLKLHILAIFKKHLFNFNCPIDTLSSNNID